MNDTLTIAVSKGRILKEALPLLAAAGIVPSDDPYTSRKLILDTNDNDVKLVIIRASDVPTYVEYGAADLGIATKYVEMTRRYFAEQGKQVEIIKLYGSMELAPLVGLADCIVDLVDTGNTLKANGLVPLELIADISSRLIVNKASMKMKHMQVKPFIERMAEAVEKAQSFKLKAENPK